MGMKERNAGAAKELTTNGNNPEDKQNAKMLRLILTCHFLNSLNILESTQDQF